MTLNDLTRQVPTVATVLFPDRMVRSRTERRRLLVSLLDNPQALFAIVVIALFVLGAALADVLAPYPPTRTDIMGSLTPPAWAEGGSTKYLLGTDFLGRDMLSRMLYGARISLIVGVAAVGVQGTVGITLGLLAGYYGRGVDSVIMRIADVQLAIPVIVLAMAVVSLMGASLRNIIIVLGLTGWMVYGRVVRAEVLSVRERAYVESARVIGCPNWIIIVRHVLPNIAASAVVVGTLQVARMIITEASLSFLGLGIQPPTPSWGGMIADGRDYIASHWWIATFPGLCILLVALAVNLLGDWLRDVLDPTLRS